VFPGASAQWQELSTTWQKWFYFQQQC
jgi:hypothetical protein